MKFISITSNSQRSTEIAPGFEAFHGYEQNGVNSINLYLFSKQKSLSVTQSPMTQQLPSLLL